LGDLADDGRQFRPAIVWFEEPVPMIEKAIEVATRADIFVVIGTSLQVYPAAGLLHYSPRASHKFIIDKKIPYFSSAPGLHLIEKPATEGVRELKQVLLSQTSERVPL